MRPTGQPIAAARRGALQPALFALALALACSSCTCAPKASPAIRPVTRTPMGRLPEAFRKQTVMVTDEGALWVDDGPDGNRAVQDGRPGPLFAEIGPPRFLPGTTRVFYWAIDLVRGERTIVLVADGERFSGGFARMGSLVFSKRGEHWAAVGGDEVERWPGEYAPGRTKIIADGKVAGIYADTSMPDFSPDGAHLAYLIERDDGKIALVVDGQEQRVFAAPGVRASPPIKNETTGPNLIRQYDARYLSDGSLFVIATDEDGWAVFHGDQRLGSYQRNVWSGPGVQFEFGSEFQHSAALVPATVATAETASVAAWWTREAGQEERWHVVRNGTPEAQVCARPWVYEPPALSADGQHVAYACHETPADQPDRVWVIHDGQRLGPYAGVWGLALSPDGRRLAFGADDGASERPWSYVVDGRPRRLQFDSLFPPRFSPDGRHVAWVAERYGRLILFLDGSGYASSDALVASPRFRPDGTLVWATARNRRLSRIEIGPSA
ncbi:MAG: TolB family protein [Candidatus Binatia bacterium]